MPFIRTKVKGILNHISQPELTQKLGPTFFYPEYSLKTESARLEFEKKAIFNLVYNLPRCDYFSQSLDYRITNWLPFYWQGFTQSTFYTYILYDISNIDNVFSGFHRSKKKNINKASKQLSIKYDMCPEEFYQHLVFTLNQVGKKCTYSKDYFLSIYNACSLRDCCAIVSAFDDKTGLCHAANFIVWDSRSAYNLISSIDYDLRISGASSLVILKAIEYVSNFVNQFDFEGSMIDSVETSFRRFSAQQTPYFRIRKLMTRKARILGAIKSICSI